MDSPRAYREGSLWPMARRIPGTAPASKAPCLGRPGQAGGQLPGCCVDPLSLRLPPPPSPLAQGSVLRGRMAVTGAS